MTKAPIRAEDFRDRVFAVVRHIPSGSTLTYKEVAKRAGNSHAARGVGAILHTNYDLTIPCHRVVRSDGTCGGYNRGVQRKHALLAAERRSRTC